VNGVSLIVYPGRKDSMYAVFEKMRHGQSRRIKILVRQLAKQGLTEEQVRSVVKAEQALIKGK
jgi:hypothetical protein